MPINFRKKDLLATGLGGLAAVALSANGVAPDMASYSGKLVEGIVKGFNFDKKNITEREQLGTNLRGAIFDALSSHGIELPDEGANAALLNMLTPENAIYNAPTDDRAKYLENKMRDILSQFDDCDMDTIPFDKITDDLNAMVEREIQKDPVLLTLEYTKKIYDDLKLANDEIQKLRLDISNSHDKIAAERAAVPHMLTPGAVCWDNPSVLGRDSFVDDVCRYLQTGAPHIQLAGMGGIGKTEILNKIYSYFASKKNVHYFDHVALLEYSGSLSSDLAGQIVGGHDVEAIWHFLRSICEKSSVLLIIDDKRLNQTEKETPKILDASFEKLFTLQATVLMASRRAISGFSCIYVDFLSTSDCIDIFQNQRHKETSGSKRQALSDKDKNLLEAIIENRVGNNTLLVNRLGAMAGEYGWNISLLDKKLEDEQFAIQKSLDDEALQEEINKLYNISDIKSENENNLLQSFALIFPNPYLSQTKCIQWMREDANVDEDRFRLMLNDLVKRTWVMTYTVDDDAGEETIYYSMHQMVSAAVLSQTEKEINKHQNLIINCLDDISYSVKEIFTKAQPYIPYAVSLANSFISEYDTGLASLMAWIGKYDDDIANYPEALEWYNKELAICEKVLGTEHPDTATTYNNIALIYDNQGDYSKALEWYQKALAICEKVLGTDHPDTATTYNNIASIYDNQGDYSKALEWYQKALAISEKVLGTDHPDTATSYNNIANIYDKQGDYPKALEWHQKALAIREKVLGTEHPVTATSYNNIAMVYDDQGDYPKALEFHQKALVIREKVLGTEHPSTATTYNNIASVYYHQGDYPKALDFYNKTFTIDEKVLGTEHPDTATSFNNIAMIYNNQGDYPKALECYQKALAIREKVLGTEHPDTATSYNNLAMLYDDQGDYPKALDLYNKALTILKKVLGPEHPSTTTVRKNIGFFQRRIQGGDA